MRQQDIYIALDWLKPALDETCQEIISMLSDVVDRRELSALSDARSLIHQISGTLKLTELNEFLVLAETMEEFCDFIAQHKRPVNDVRELLQATTVLQFELNELHRTKKKHKGLLYQRANYLRETMGKSRLGKDVGHAINLQHILPDNLHATETLDEDALDRLSQAWREHTLSRIKGNTEALSHLSRVAEFLCKGADGIPQAALWNVAHEWLLSLVKNTATPLEHYVHTLNELGDSILTAEGVQKVENIIVDMLIQLIGMQALSPKANALIATFSPQSNHTKSGRILDSVFATLEETIELVDDKTQRVVQKLTEAMWLLEVGGWQLYQQFLHQIIDEIRNITIRQSEQEDIWRIKRQMTELKEAISKTRQLLGDADTIKNGAIQEATSAVLREARINLETIKAQFNDYCATRTFKQLADIPDKLVQVMGVFRIVEQERAVGVVERLTALFNTILASDALKVLTWSEIDAIADTISSLEYFFDLLAQHYHDESVLANAEQRLTEAETLLKQNIAQPIALSSIGQRRKVLSDNEPQYDDTSDISQLEDVDMANNAQDTEVSDSGDAEDSVTATELSTATDAVMDVVGNLTSASTHIAEQDAIDIDDLGDFAGTPEATQDHEHASSVSGHHDLMHEKKTDEMEPIMDETLLTQHDLPDSDELHKAKLLLGEDDFGQDDEIREIFIEEAEEVLEHIHRYIPLWEADVQDLALLTEVRRGFHTLKGSGRMVGANQSGEVAWATENLLNRVLEKQLEPHDDVIAFVKQSIAMVPAFVEDFACKQTPRYNPLVPIVQANNIIAGKPINAGLVVGADALHAKVDDTGEAVSHVVVEDALNVERIPDEAQATDAPSRVVDDEVAATLQNEKLIIPDAAAAGVDDINFDFDGFDDFDLPSDVPTQSTELGLSEGSADFTEKAAQPIQDTVIASTGLDSQLAERTDTDETVDASDVAVVEQLVPVDVEGDAESNDIARKHTPTDHPLEHWMSSVVEPIPDDLNCSEDIKEIFVEEAGEVLEHINNSLPLWRHTPDNKVALADIRRGFHTLKGSGRMVGANKLGEVAWHVEDMLNRVIDGAIPASSEVVSIVDAAITVIPGMVSSYAQGNHDTQYVKPLMAAAKSYANKQGINPANALKQTLGDAYVQVEEIAEHDVATLTSPEQVAIVDDNVHSTAAIELDGDGAEQLSESMSRDAISPVIPEAIPAVETEALTITSPMASSLEQPVTVDEQTATEKTVDSAFDGMSFELDGDDFAFDQDEVNTAPVNATHVTEQFDDSDDFDFDLPEVGSVSADIEPVIAAGTPDVASSSISSADHSDVHSHGSPAQALTASQAANTTPEMSAVNGTATPQSQAKATNTADVIRDVFIEEAESIITDIQTFADSHPDGGEVTDDIIRALHTLRGSAAMSGIEVLRELNMSMEVAFRHLMDNRIDLTAEHVLLLQAVCTQSAGHIQAYKDGNINQATQRDIDLIDTIHDMTSLDEISVSDDEKVHVAELVELDIDDLLDAEWELEKYLLAEDNADYVDTLSAQISRLYKRVSHIPDLSDMLLQLDRVYKRITNEPSITDNDVVLDTLLSGHRNITTMFDAMAASQRVNCEPEMLQRFAQLHEMLDVRDEASTQPAVAATSASDDVDAELIELADIDAALSMQHADTVDSPVTKVSHLVEPAAVVDITTDERDTQQATEQVVDSGSAIMPESMAQVAITEEDTFLSNLSEIDAAIASQDEVVVDADHAAGNTVDSSKHTDELSDVEITPVVDELEEATDDTMPSAILDELSLDSPETKTETLENEQPTVVADVVDSTPPSAQSLRYETNFETDLLSIFLEEAEEISLDIDNSMNIWAANPGDVGALAELQRHLHTIKGGARMVGLTSIGDLTHEAESVYEMLVVGKLSGTPAILRFMRHTQDVVSQQIDELNTYNRSFYADDELDTIRAFVSDMDESRLSDFFNSRSAVMPAVPVPESAAVQSAVLEPAIASQVTLESAATAPVPNVSAITESSSDDTAAAPVASVSNAANSIDIASVTVSVDASVSAQPWEADSAPDEDMLEIFLEEASEIVDASSTLLYEWVADIDQTDKLQALQRELHTLKGGARMAGVASLGDLSHEMEFIYEDLALRKKQPNAEIVKVLSQSHDWLAEAVTVLHDGLNPGQPDALIAPLKAFMADADAFSLMNFASGSLAHMPAVDADVSLAPSLPTDDTADRATSDTPAGHTELPQDAQTERIERKTDTAESPVNDLAETQQPAVVSAETTTSFIDIEQSKTLDELRKQQDPSRQAQVFDLPAMEGEFVDTDEQQSSNEMIRISSPLIEKMINLSGEAAINRGRVEVSNTSLTNSIEEMGSTVQRLADQLRRMDIELEAQILAQYEGELSQHEDFDPLEMDQYSALNQLSKSLAESASDLLDIKSTMLDKTRETEGLLLQQSRIQTELQEGLMNSRLVPFSRLNARLQRIIRQTANELGKSAELFILNADSEVDRTVLDRITSPLEHMLRNAVGHGIELPNERKIHGKSTTGRIELSVKREGGEIVITVTDDGKGINVAAVRKKAEERGLIQNQELSDTDIMQYIFHAGLTTAEKVTQISGRGVGMDVVQSEIKQLGGAISVVSEAGKGSTFTLRLPLTVAVADALVVRSADRYYAIPLVQIERIERVSIDDIKAYYQSDETSIQIAGGDYRLRYLNTMLNDAAVADFSQVVGSVPVIVAKTAAGPKQAIQVDELSGSRTEIVVKPLGNQLSKTQGVSAATILGDGSVMLIIDLLALIRQAPVEKRVLDLSSTSTTETKVDEKIQVMVVDDSVTVRKVTTRLLERNGFIAHTAKDGVDAIEKLQDIKPDVMLLDIEMPRMDGFEVASQVRNNQRLKDVPIIMITSRTGEKHRERAFEIGVNCYMGKPFQEKELLENLDELLNQVTLDV